MKNAKKPRFKPRSPPGFEPGPLGQNAVARGTDRASIRNTASAKMLANVMFVMLLSQSNYRNAWFVTYLTALMTFLRKLHIPGL